MNNTNSIFGNADLSELTDVTLELGRIEDLANDVAKTLTNAFRAATLEGKSLNNLLSDIGRSFADIALKAALKPLGGLVSNLVEGVFSATNPALQGVTPFAKGGVVATPSFFSFGSGNLGLAGEAGPEAILPLARGSDGRLGVASNGSMGATTINFNIKAQDARSFVAAEAEVSAMLLRAVKRGTRAS